VNLDVYLKDIIEYSDDMEFKTPVLIIGNKKDEIENKQKNIDQNSINDLILSYEGLKISYLETTSKSFDDIHIILDELFLQILE
jgi:hypothetical protein